MSAESPAQLSADVCVVGAGPDGLALAVALGRAGKSVTVVEESREFERHFRGESISPDSVWLLRQLGVLGDLEAEGIMRTKRLEIHENGQRLVNVDFAEFRHPESWPMEIPRSCF